jgi:diguanylate cyclase (GGDEF)-like protein
MTNQAASAKIASPDRPERRRFARRVSAIFLVLGLILGTVAVQVYRAVGDFVEATRWVTHSLKVRQEISSTIASLREAEASQRAYLISGVAERLADFAATEPQISSHTIQLQELVSDDPQQSDRAAALAKMLEARLSAIHDVIEQYSRGGLDAARASAQVARSRDEDLRIDAVGDSMLVHEDKLLADRETHTSGQALQTRLMTVGAVVSSMLILGIALFLVLREQRQRLASMLEAKSANRALRKSLDDSQRLGKSLRELSELGEMLQGCRSLDEAVAGLNISLPRLLPASSGSIHMINASQNLIEAIAHWGSADDSTASIFGPDDCWALRRGHAYPLAGTTPAFACRHLQESKESHPEHSHLCVPMIAQGEILGVISVTSERDIRDAERSNMVAACDSISMALANLKLQETLRTQSLRDPLTGLFNRRYLEASFEREIQRAERRKIPLSVLMLDVDHFKRFNDGFGHDAGDTLLAHFGALLARVVRTEDVTCRYGGEEFTVLMPEADTELARTRAEEICAAVRAMNVEHRNISLGKITVSIGVATYKEHGRTPEELMRNADNALYLAKNSGRDQVWIAETLHPGHEQDLAASPAHVGPATVARLGPGKPR